MGPRKDKADKKGERASVDDSATMILNYLRDRPYSATEISANLHNKVSKGRSVLPAAAKVLKDLHEKTEIEGRPAGNILHAFSNHALPWLMSHRQADHLYSQPQNPTDSITPEALQSLDAQVNSLRTATTSLHARAKTLRATLSSLNSTLSTSDLVSSVSALEAEKAAITARLESLKRGKVKKVTQKEREDVESEWRKWKGVSARRVKIAGEMWKMVEDAHEGDKEKIAEVREMLGLDD
ncbi:hypothetical protein EJ04DRAFT_445512 [Polyplosphaeria fusca]|uniref:Homologous-pairing protein 2 homolog n=1 Tax=Polyplosphaeria fusca TaxID=682080 RepID=A0A9P4QPF5_9PLEO|nr:hypothetical protein EJ04DRAFT_445512 [Polyplosphaeria fusca]